ncbi:MAG: Wzz/FepE/Etk N-terminal domain-containing protein [Actinomycetota bacterium]|nr:Wzz/FepE/Etk N-terminal domain-containing protein [Actinomycetota bacterium]
MSADLPEDRIEFRQYLAVLRRQRLMIAAVTGSVIAIALAYAALAPPVYQARAEVLVQPANPTSSTAAALPPSMDTEKEILVSESVALKAAEKLGWSGTIGDLLQHVEVEIPPETQVLDVSFSGESPEAAERGAESFAESYLEFRSDQVKRSLLALETARRQELDALRDRLEIAERDLQDFPKGSAQYLEAQARQQDLLAEMAAVQRQITTLVSANVSSGEIIAHATAQPEPVSPNTKIALAAGIFFGLFAGVVLAFVRHSIQGRIGGRSETEEALGAPVLSVIPRTSRWRRDDGSLATLRGTGSITAQNYRVLGASLIRARGRGGRTFLVTGAATPDGSTSVAANLAVVLAQAGHRVGLVGAPLDTQMAKMFGTSANGGVPAGGQQPGLQRTRVRGVWLFRPPEKGLGEDLSHPVEARDVLDRILDVMDFAVVHAGPLLTSAEAIALAPAVDGVVVVADGRRARRRTLRRLHTTVQRVGGKLLGAVITGFRSAEAETYDEQTEPQGPAEPSWPALPPPSRTLA